MSVAAEADPLACDSTAEADPLVCDPEVVEVDPLTFDPEVVEVELAPLDADAVESEPALPGSADACPAPVITAAPSAIAKANADTSRVPSARGRSPPDFVLAARAFALARFFTR